MLCGETAEATDSEHDRITAPRDGKDNHQKTDYAD